LTHNRMKVRSCYNHLSIRHLACDLKGLGHNPGYN
jgi:hypothetical protein